MNINNGFLLTSHWRDTPSGMEISFYGASDKKPFKLVFTRQKIVFFIPSTSKFSPSDFQYERKSGKLKSFSHVIVDTIYLDRYKDLGIAKEYCKQNGIPVFEIDILPTERFLMERFINGSVEFSGDKKSTSDIDIFENPQIRKTNTHTQLSILSLDIETGIAGELYSIGLYYEYKTDSGIDRKQKVLMLNSETRTHDDLLEFYDSEKEILLNFMAIVKLWDPDLITGWHVVGFDLKFIFDKCLKLGVDFVLGRSGGKLKLTESKASGGMYADTYGRVILDGPRILRGAFYTFKNFKLETVASEVLGTGKDIASDSGKGSEIERRFKEDKPALAKYNLLDCTLVTDIYNKLNLIDLLVKRVSISGLLLDRLQVSTAAFDHMFLPRLHRKGYVAPNRLDFARGETSTGGMVVEPTAGLHENVAIFDFRSLYPSIIMTFNIDPLSLIRNDINTNETPSQISFSKTEHILPAIIREFMHERELAKECGNKNLSQSIKILMNSFYGVMGSSSCRFYHAELPSAITLTGHWILQKSIEFFKSRGLEVVYGDTDSVFVKLNDASLKSGEVDKLTEDLNYLLKRIIMDEYGVESELICEYEKIFDKVFFSQARSGIGAAKKRYAGITNGELEFKGMEFVRSDWTEVAKKFQGELYQRFFTGLEMEVEPFIKEYIRKLEAGEFDSLLIYTKRLTKPPEEYIKNVPPHVKAALKINHTGPYRLKEVSYVITKLGPEPVLADSVQSFDFDYQHYIEKQLRPIANDVLHTIDKDFDSFILGTQLSLF